MSGDGPESPASPGGRVAPAYFALFASIYAVQGAVAAYFFTFNLIYLTSCGVPPSVAADAQSVALLPFILKFLAGPLSDRFSLLGLGHRKPYIVLGLAVQALALAGLATVDPGRQVGAFTALALLAVAGMALGDTCCDGMVIDVTPPGDRDRVQGALVASRALAAMACASGFGLWVGRSGGSDRYRELLWACAAAGLVPLSQALFLAEPRPAGDAERFRWSALRVLVRPRSLALLAYGAAFATIANGVEIHLSPYYKALGFGGGALGALAALRYVGRAAGGALLPLASGRLGRGGALALGVAALATTTAMQAAVPGGGAVAAGVGATAFGAACGWADALFFVLAMEASDPRMAASTYALFMAVTNVSVAGGSLFDRARSRLDGRYGPAFLASALGFLAVLAFVPRLARPPRPEILPGPPD
jgi:MFS transporter, PAT family, beta-lactamase induction signal transducer AmpG